MSSLRLTLSWWSGNRDLFGRRLSRLAQALAFALVAAVVGSACGSSSTTSTGPSPTKCGVSLDAAPKSFGAAGGDGTVSVATQPECAWTASLQATWMADLTPTSGQGNGQVTFHVPANPAPASRSGEIDVNGTRVSVSQEAAACAYSITPANQSIGAGGGAGTAIAVATSAGCAWSAASTVPWITVTSGATGNGNGSVGFTIAANTGGSRTGTLTIAGQTFTVTQAAVGCVYTIDSASQSIGAPGGSGTPVNVTTTAACAWTATSGVPWITVTTGATGTGNGSVSFSIAANTGAERTGTVTIAGQTVTVTQAAVVVVVPCSYSLNPTTQSIGAAGGAGTAIAVTAGSGCAWTATSGVPWITLTPGTGSGSGNGTVGFTVAANTGALRTGTLTIGGQTFTVTQAAVPIQCSYSINSTTQLINAAGGAGTPIAVTAPAGCAWTVTNNANTWITVTTGVSGGSGNGTVGFTVAANTGPSRSGTLTIAGQTFTVTQAGGCSFSIGPTTELLGAATGAGNPVAVTAATGCTWTVTTGVPWLTVTTGANGGSGNGTVGFTVAANTGPSRTGMLTIAGQTFTVTQASGCSYVINPTSQSFSLVGGTGQVSVTTAAGCTWTATSGVAWIRITSPVGAGGTGSGPLGFSVDLYAGPSRTGMLTIAGQIFTVTQTVLP